MTPAPHTPNPRTDEPEGDGTITLAPGVRVPRAVVDIDFSRSSGPGGQNVNKLSTRCQLRIRISDLPIHPEARLRLEASAGSVLVGDGELLIDAQSERSAERNRTKCFEKLRELIVKAMARPKVRRKTKPSRGSIERRLTAKKTRSETKRRRAGQD